MSPREFFDLVKACRKEFKDFAKDKDRKHMNKYFEYAHMIDEEIQRVDAILAQQKE